VLAALAARPGRLMTKDELLKEVWLDSFVEKATSPIVFASSGARRDSRRRDVETVPKHGSGSSPSHTC
jgi:DNA-binding winged helix-turn-helix (wHTH) protein